MPSLTPEELLVNFEAVIKPFEHPDPLGFVVRALIESEGDPDYIGLDGKVGFMPVAPPLASELVGAENVHTLDSNLIACLAMDRMFFEQHKTIEGMIINFHFGDDAVLTPTQEMIEYVQDVAEQREEVRLLMYPPLATVKDVIEIIKESQKGRKLTKSERQFFNAISGQ